MTYRRVVRTLSVAILGQALKEPGHEQVNRLINLLPDKPFKLQGHTEEPA